MKAQALALTLLLFACGGPEELGMTEDAIGIDPPYDPCTSDDVPDAFNCAAPLYRLPIPVLQLTANDVDWFTFKSGARSKLHVFWSEPTSTALTECWLYRRDIFANIPVGHGKPCYINRTLAGNATTYYLEVRGGLSAGSIPSTGNYQMAWYTPHEADTNPDPYEPCPDCTAHP